MGNYTELVLAFELKKDTPKYIYNTLFYMIHGKTPEKIEIDMFFLGSKARHRFMLQSSSYYFSYPQSFSKIYYDNITETHHVSIRCSFKNYENEIGSFLQWIKPYIYGNRHKFLGYSMYEEADKPTLIYLEDCYDTHI